MNSHGPDQMGPPAIAAINLQGHFEKSASGKVRKLFEVDNEDYSFVASHRISWDKGVYHSPSATFRKG